jgi:uncharacterized protein
MTSDSVTGRPHLGPVAWLVHAGIRAYQWLFAWRPSPCRYVPSCSNYALEAVEVHGAWRGSWLAVRRIGRCHPWAPTGWDPVPPCSHPTHPHRGSARRRRAADSPTTPKAA